MKIRTEEESIQFNIGSVARQNNTLSTDPFSSETVEKLIYCGYKQSCVHLQHLKKNAIRSKRYTYLLCACML